MPRNSSGTYVLPEAPFVPSTPISSSTVNSDFSDVAAALTDSLSRTGNGGMQAALGLHIDGFNYVADTDTGMRRSAANTQVIECGGVGVIEVTPTQVSILGTRLFQLPIGLGPLPWSGLSAPAGWVLAYGQTLSRATYAALWAFAQAEIAGGNTLYGVGDGSTTFTVPDLRGRVPAGKDNMGGVAAGRLTVIAGTTLGAAGGDQSVVLTVGQLPAHTHANTLNDLGHTHATTNLNGATVLTSAGGATNYAAGANGANTVISGFSINSATTGISINNVSTGSGSDHLNVQPTIVTNYIIFAGA